MLNQTQLHPAERGWMVCIFGDPIHWEELYAMAIDGQLDTTLKKPEKVAS